LALYEFNCAVCGAFDVRRPATVRDDVLCPVCGQRAQRIFHSPLLRAMAEPMRAAREREAKSAHQPQVVRRPVAH
jgi:putative FmdB family regulatory protein